MKAPCKVPCPNCPFREGAFAAGTFSDTDKVATAIEAGEVFACHKTIELQGTNSIAYHLNNTSPNARQCCGSQISAGQLDDMTGGTIMPLPMFVEHYEGVRSYA